jgi:hypothetical protein
MSAESQTRGHTHLSLNRIISIVTAATCFAACNRDTPTAPNSSMRLGTARTDLATLTDYPDWVGNLLGGNTILVADPASTQEELPGLGHKFQLFHATVDDVDPQNSTNDVISVETTPDYPAGSGLAVRNLPPGIKIAALDHQLNVRYYFPAPRSCYGGSPRFQLAIDSDGDGDFDGNAFGYVGHTAFGGGCITGEWDNVDMTDNVGRWDLSQLGGGMAMTWDQAQAFVTTTYPNHQVLTGSLADDACSFGAPLACGRAYYDLVTIENRSIENRQDTVH